MTEEYYDKDGFRLLFEDDTDQAEKQFFMRAFPNVNRIVDRKIHCTSCQIHIGTAPVSEAFIRMHPVLRVTHCRTCHAFYNSGEFDKGEDGSELYCRWCGQGGEVYCCSKCPYVFCKSCIMKNLSRACVHDIARNENWHCFSCAPKIMWHLRAQHWALMNFIEKQKKDIKMQHQLSPASVNNLFKQDLTSCCPGGRISGGKGSKGNQTVAAHGSKKTNKRTDREQEDEDNLVLSKIRLEKSGGSGSSSSSSSSILKEMTVKPMVVIPPLSPSLLGLEASSSSAKRPATASATASSSSEPKQSKKLKHKQGKPEQEQGPQPPAAKKSRSGDNEVVCTPDILNMLNMLNIPDEATPPATTAGQLGIQGILVAGSSKHPPASRGPNKPTGGSVPSVAATPLAPPASTGVPKPKAILHKALPRNLSVRLAAPEPAPSSDTQLVNYSPNQQAESTRAAGASSTRTVNPQPVFHFINGYRIDLQTASQQATCRLPNGKLIQVRKQSSDLPASTSVRSATQAQDVAQHYQQPDAAATLVRPQMAISNPMDQLPTGLAGLAGVPRLSGITGSPILPGNSNSPAAPQVFTSLYQPQPSAMLLPQQSFAYVPHQQPQYQQLQPQQGQHHHQQQRQQQQHQVHEEYLQEQQLHHQQQLQLQQQQQQQQFQRVVKAGRPAQMQRLRQKLTNRSQPYPRAQPQQQQQQQQANAARAHATPQVPLRVINAQPNRVNVPIAPAPTAAAHTGQFPILHMLRGLVAGPHEDTPLGHARKDFEEKLLAGVESCNHIILKIHTLTNSNSFKNIRNLGDLKELFIHVSYLMKYGIGRFRSVHERCVADVKKMGFTKQSDFVMMGEKINNRNPEDDDNSDNDDDCEIIEQNTTVIQVDSDDEGNAKDARDDPGRQQLTPSNATMPASSADQRNVCNSSVTQVDDQHDTNATAASAADVNLTVSSGPNGISLQAREDVDTDHPSVPSVTDSEERTTYTTTPETVESNAPEERSPETTIASEDQESVGNKTASSTDELVEIIEMDDSECTADVAGAIGMCVDEQPKAVESPPAATASKPETTDHTPEAEAAATAASDSSIDDCLDEDSLERLLLETENIADLIGQEEEEELQSAGQTLEGPIQEELLTKDSTEDSKVEEQAMPTHSDADSLETCTAKEGTAEGSTEEELSESFVVLESEEEEQSRADKSTSEHILEEETPEGSTQNTTNESMEVSDSGVETQNSASDQVSPGACLEKEVPSEETQTEPAISMDVSESAEQMLDDQVSPKASLTEETDDGGSSHEANTEPIELPKDEGETSSSGNRIADVDHSDTAASGPNSEVNVRVGDISNGKDVHSPEIPSSDATMETEDNDAKELNIESEMSTNETNNTKPEEQSSDEGLSHEADDLKDSELDVPGDHGTNDVEKRCNDVETIADTEEIANENESKRSCIDSKSNLSESSERDQEDQPPKEDPTDQRMPESIAISDASELAIGMEHTPTNIIDPENPQKGENATTAVSDDNVCSDPVDGSEDSGLKREDSITELGSTLNETATLRANTDVVEESSGLKREDSITELGGTLNETTKPNDEGAQSSTLRADSDVVEESSAENVTDQDEHDLAEVSTIDEAKEPSAIDTDAVERLSEDKSDKEVINLMDFSDETDLNETYSEEELFGESTKPEAVTLPAADDGTSGTIKEVDINDTAAEQKRDSPIALNDASGGRNEDGSSNASSSRDEYIDAATGITNEPNEEVNNGNTVDVAMEADGKDAESHPSLVGAGDDVMQAIRVLENQENAVAQPSEAINATEVAPETSSLEAPREP